MILSNTEIRKAIAEKRIIIDPRPASGFKTTALDLTLGREFAEPRRELGIALKPTPGKISSTLHAVYESKFLTDDESYYLNPNEFILAQTHEEIALPLTPDECGLYLAARVEGKSSLARHGLLVHFTAPTIHAGFQGVIALEMINLGAFPLLLRPEMPICQLIFEQVLGVPEENPSSFQGQSHPTGVQ